MVRTWLEREESDKKETPTSQWDQEVSAASVQDFQMAAQYGNKFAKQELVRTNPYAKMCNAMLKDVMARYQGK